MYNASITAQSKDVSILNVLYTGIEGRKRGTIKAGIEENNKERKKEPRPSIMSPMLLMKRL